MTALWQRYENCQEVQPTSPTPEVQARLSRLEKEVLTLKALLQSQDEELTSRDLIISEKRSTKARLEKEVSEANERYTRSVIGLSAELDRADQLGSRLLQVFGAP
jgi:chromosome segregation ATPase